MRIVHILWALETGGVETMLVDIVNEQVNMAEVAIIVVNDLINPVLLSLIDKRCEVSLLRRKTGSRNPWPWVRLNFQLAKFHPDIIHFHLEGIRKMVFYSAPKVFTIHNTHTSGKEYPKFHALYAISDAVKAYTERQGFGATTIHNGIYPEKIKVRNVPLKSKPPYRLVCVGRLYSPHKGQDLLIQALGILKKRRISAFHIDLIGDGQSGKDLENMVVDNGLESDVTFLGHRNRSYVYKHLCDYDLFVLPSRSEGFGLSVAEAICAKIPVLVSNLEGPTEVLDGGRYGMLFEHDDAESLADQLELFARKGYDGSKVEEAYQYVCEHFNIVQTAKKYVEEYRIILK